MPHLFVGGRDTADLRWATRGHPFRRNTRPDRSSEGTVISTRELRLHPASLADSARRESGALVASVLAYISRDFPAPKTEASPCGQVFEQCNPTPPTVPARQRLQRHH